MSFLTGEFLFGLLFFGVAAYQTGLMLARKKRGVLITAKVVELVKEERRDDDGFVYMPVYEIVDCDENKISGWVKGQKIKSDFESLSISNRLGETVHVIYEPHTDKIISYSDLTRHILLTTFFMIIGAGIIIVPFFT